ncbi:MAG: tetratricopeptide repeat protein [Rhodospirillales bacterium]|nr:tetratricopeptide repeat protein [Rhodospirillales bacterium]
MTRIGKALVASVALAAVLLSAAAAAGDGFDRALSLASEGRHADARRLLGPLLESEPGDPQLRLLDGILQMQEGRRDEAIAVFSGLAREYPDMFEAHNNLAVAYVEEGRLEEARAILAAILERSPSAAVYRNLGDIYVQLARRAFSLGRGVGGTAGDGDQGRDAGAELMHARDAAGSTSGAATAATREGGGDPDTLPAEPQRSVAALAEFCVATGEFSDMAAVEEARQWFRARGAGSAQVARGSRETVRSYRVYLPPLESRSSAREKMREVQEQGVHDIAVVLSGALRNAVSLGVYAREANAKRRMAQLEGLGYAPVLEPNTREVAAYATIEARVGGSYDSLSDAWASRFPDQTVRQVDCD